MTHNPQLVDTIARAIYEAEGDSWEGRSACSEAYFRILARATLDAMRPYLILGQAIA